ncbi:MAG: nitroreductase family protein [Nitrospirota bacterium]|jgi:nitroreductase
MNVMQAIRERRSIRRYTDYRIPDETLDRLSDALIWAPSAGNLQSRKFYFVRDDVLKMRLAAAALNQIFIAEAPLVVVGCTDSLISTRYGERGVELYSIQDVSASVMCMMLAAYELGLGTVWVGAFREKEVAAALSLPGNLRPVAIVPVGRPARIPKPPPRVSKGDAIILR